MSTSLLYHAWSIRNHKHQSTKFEGGSLIFRIAPKPFSLRCPCCQSRKLIKRGNSVRRFRTLPIGHHPVWIELAVPRVECRRCGAVRQVDLDFADSRRRHTKSFARYVLELSRLMTIQDVACHLRISWDTVKDIQKQHLQQRFAKPKLGKLRHLAIDEIYLGKRSGFVSLVMDLDSGAVVEVAEGKHADALLPFWKRLHRSRARIEAVATDMGPAYIKAVREHLPQATLVFDHFHVIKLFNEKLTDLRRTLVREAEGLDKQVLKGTRWLLLKTPSRLDTDKNEQARLQEALRLNQPLATAYYMKEDLRRIWRQDDKESAAFLLEDWIKRAAASGIRMLKQFANTLASFRTGILAYYDFNGLSTGPLEGTNNKIKTLQKMAYGFRDREFLKLKIKALHESKYALVG